MDDQNFKDLALQAWELYTAIDELRKRMLRMFIDEFIAIDELKQKQDLQRALSGDDLPF